MREIDDTIMEFSYCSSFIEDEAKAMEMTSIAGANDDIRNREAREVGCISFNDNFERNFELSRSSIR